MKVWLKRIIFGFLAIIVLLLLIGILFPEDPEATAAREARTTSQRTERALQDSIRTAEEAAAKEAEERSRSLDALVRVTGVQLLVTNVADFDWTNCKIEINSGLIRGGWSQDVARIGAGETMAGGLMAFTTSRGERFNPGTHSVQQVSVRCDTPAGRASYHGVW